MNDIVQTLQPEELNGFLSRTRKGDPLAHFEHRLADDLRDILQRSGPLAPAHGGAVLLESPLCSIYTRQRNPVFDEALRKGRSRFSPIQLFARGDGVKPIIRALRQHIPFFMLPDMDFGARDAAFVPFFGHLAATLTAPARIAASTQAQVVPVVARFLPSYRGWQVEFYPAWENYPGDDIIAATRHMNAFIEQRILEAPEEYFWSHKRFKTRPPGMPSLYQRASAVRG